MLANPGAGGRRIAVLGDMRELGEESDRMHAAMGETARALGVTRLFAYGPRSRSSVTAFGTGGQHFDDQASLIAALRPALTPAVRLLVKGSRSMGMERVVSAALEPMERKEAG